MLYISLCYILVMVSNRAVSWPLLQWRSYQGMLVSRAEALMNISRLYPSD